MVQCFTDPNLISAYDGALNADFLTTATTDHMYDQIKKKVRKMYVL